MLKYAVISSDRSGSYMFMLPIAALCWRRVAGYEPLILLTETAKEWEGCDTGHVVLNSLYDIGVSPNYIGYVSEPYRTSVQAQASRQHAGALNLDPDSYLLTTDIDMLPLTRDWFHKEDPSKDVHIWWASAWDWRWFTTPYTGAKLMTWREIMGINPLRPINLHLQQAFDKHLTPLRDTYQEWFFDEYYTNSRLKGWHGYPDRVQFMDRIGKPPYDRIDRGNWPSQPNIMGKTDAHLPRPTFKEDNWLSIRYLLNQLLPESDMKLIDAYQKDFSKVAQ